MAITYELLPNPKWYIADLVGRPLGAGYMFTYRSLDKTQLKFIYQDPAGNFAWPDPVFFDENGSQGPFYWAVDSLNPDETYYLEVFDMNNVLQWTIDNFGPGSGGGGGNVTTAINLDNLVINPVFWRNIGVTATPILNNTVLCPGAHSGFGGNATPDITFVKSPASTATDQISFIKFNSNALTGDTTPEYYLNYSCTNTPTMETLKEVRYPINIHTQNLNNTTVSITVWARCNSGTNTAVVSFYQFFGDGTAASAPIETPIQTLTLTSTWTQYTFTTVVPPVTGSGTTTVGACGNDALYLAFQYPLTASTSIDHTKLSMFLGNIAPTMTFIDYDDIDATINSPRTGDIKIASGNFSLGYVPLNDGTIGSASSNATSRANIDTFPLYDLLWNAVSQTYAPLFNSAGVLTARGADSASDFSANNQLSLTRQLGRVIAGTETPQISQTFTVDHLASPPGNSNMTFTSGTTANYFTGAPVQVSGGLPSPLAPNTTYYAINISSTVIQLATTFANATAVSPVPIVFNTNGVAPINVIVTPYVVGQTTGQDTVQLAAHTHTIPGSVNNAFGGSGSSGYNQFGSSTTTTSSAGSTTQFSAYPPTIFMNMFMKL